MLFPGQQFLLPVSHNDMMSWDWLYIPNSVHNVIKNTILTTPQPNTPESEVYLDAQNNKALIALNNKLYAVNLQTDNDAIIINNWLAEVSFHNSRTVKGKTRDFEPLSINVTAEECEPFIEWMNTMYNNKDNGNFIPSISPDIKALFASWIQQLWNVPIDMEVASAMIYYGHWGEVLTELNSNPENYYIELNPDMDLEWFKIEHSEECYPWVALQPYEGEEVVLYYANNPEKNFDTIYDDLYSIDESEFQNMLIRGDDWTENINWRVYSFEPTSESSANVKVIISGWGYQTSVSIEPDISVDEITYNIPDEEEPEPSRGVVRTVAANWWISNSFESCHMQ